MKVLRIAAVIIIILFGIQLSAQAELAEQMENFELIDTNGDVLLDKNEMIKFYLDRFDEKGERIHGVVLFSTFDTDNNDIVTLEEFLVGSISKKVKEKGIVKAKAAISEKKADKTKNTVTKNTEPKKVSAKNNSKNDTPIRKKKKEAFRTMDINGDGVIVLEEMVNFYKGKKNKKGEQIEGDVLFFGYDKNRSNKVSFSEFLKNVNWKLGKERARLHKK